VGGPRKGVSRNTSVSVAVETTQSILTDAVSKGVEEALKTWATFTLPSLAPQIFAAYMIYNRLKDTIKVLKEYKELTKTMSPEKAALVEAERIVTRETAKAIVRKASDEQITTTVYALTGALLSRPEMEEITHGDERFKYMLLATLSQFFIGMITGGRDSMIDHALRLIK
jgi:hypothetical protein